MKWLLSFLLVLPLAVQAAVVGKSVEYEADGVKMKGWLAHDDAF